MVNSQTITEIEEALKIDRQIEKIPSPIPVVEVNPKIVKNCLVKTATATGTGNTTIFTTNAKNKTYIIGYVLTWHKDAAADSTSARIMVPLSGVSTILGYITALTATAYSQSIMMSLNHPMLVDKNGTCIINTTKAAGNHSISTTLIYFEDEVN
jgi:hypothetical protein